MGFMDKFKSFIGIDEEYDDDDYYEEEYEEVVVANSDADCTLNSSSLVSVTSFIRFRFTTSKSFGTLSPSDAFNSRTPSP